MWALRLRSRSESIRRVPVRPINVLKFWGPREWPPQCRLLLRLIKSKALLLSLSPILQQLRLSCWLQKQVNCERL